MPVSGRALTRRYCNDRIASPASVQFQSFDRSENWIGAVCRTSVVDKMNFNPLPDTNRRTALGDDCGQNSWSFIELDIGDDTRQFGPSKKCCCIDPSQAPAFLPFKRTRQAKRAQSSRIPMDLAAVGALRQNKAPCPRGLPERCPFSSKTLGLVFSFHAHTRSRISVELACRVAMWPPVAWTQASSQFLTWTAGWASSRNCRTASITLVIPPRLAG